jgi:hypothetical protein
MKRFVQLSMALSLALAAVTGANAAGLLLSLTEEGEMGRPDLAALKAELPQRIQRRDMTVSTQVAVVRLTGGSVQARGGFDGTCSLVDAERFRDGTADRTANDATRELMKSASALVRVADQQRLSLGHVAICLVSDRPKDFVLMLKLPPPGFVARAEAGMAYLVLPSGVFMFTL